jgi:predicted ArsR family transcriptional regulator
VTSERLDTLRFVRRHESVTTRDLADGKYITYTATLGRLRRCKQSGLVRSEVNTRRKVRPGHGSAPLSWSITKRGRQKLIYFEEHLEEISYTID